MRKMVQGDEGGSSVMQATEVLDGKGPFCREVLEDLTTWFGIEAARERYVAAATDLTLFGIRDKSEPIGFITLRKNTAHAVEMVALGVKQRFHRRGLGRVLIDAALAFAREGECRFVTVKTLAASHPDPHYAATRRFYGALGFVEIEVFPNLWGSTNPCVMMIREV